MFQLLSTFLFANIIFLLTYYILEWFMVLLLAIINSDAVYDEIKKETIIELSQKDKIWKKVVKLLELK